MKNYKTILQAIKANADAIAVKEGQIEDLELRFEKQAAHRAGDLEKVKELAAISRQHQDEVITISEDIYRLKLENAVLRENAKASFSWYALPIIADACSKYNGKQYGERTQEKIRDEVRAHGIGLYFQGYSSKTTLNIYALNNEGYHFGNELDLELYTMNYNEPFVTEDNKLNFQALNVNMRYKYADNPTAQVNKIIKTYNAYKAAMEKAKGVESALNDILPENIGHYNNTGYIKALVY